MLPFRTNSREIESRPSSRTSSSLGGLVLHSSSSSSSPSSQSPRSPLSTQSSTNSNNSDRLSIFSSSDSCSSVVDLVRHNESSRNNNKNESGSVQPEESFPIDTVKQIYDDIEKLFTEGEESGKLVLNSNSSNSARSKSLGLVAAASSQLAPSGYPKKYLSNWAHCILNRLIVDNFVHLPVPHYLRMCTVELGLLETQLNQCANVGLIGPFEQKLSFQSSSHPFSSSHQQQKQSSFSSSSLSANKFELNDLHILMWKLFTMYDKLLEFAQTFNSIEEDEKQMKLNDTIDRWYAIAVAIKDLLITTSNVAELRALLGSIKRQHVHQLWAATRQMRTLLWLL